MKYLNRFERKILMAVLLLAFTGELLTAQSGGAESANKAADGLSLETVCSFLAARPNTSGDFTQTKSLQTNGRKLKSSGKFIICPEGILWKTEKPFPSSLILTKTAMVQIGANGSKSVMSGKDNQIFANISETLSSVFSGNAAELKKLFTYDFTEDKNGLWSLLLTPKDSTIASVMKNLVLSGQCNVKEGTAVLDSLEMAETSGNSILYEFSNQKYPEVLSDAEKANFIVE